MKRIRQRESEGSSEVRMDVWDHGDKTSRCTCPVERFGVWRAGQGLESGSGFRVWMQGARDCLKRATETSGRLAVIVMDLCTMWVPQSDCELQRRQRRGEGEESGFGIPRVRDTKGSVTVGAQTREWDCSAL